MRFDVLGRIVSARVTSFREVDFRDFRAGGFMIVFRPGPFDNAPHSFIAASRAERTARARPPPGTHRRRLPEHLRHRFARGSRHVKTIVDNVTLAVTVVGALVSSAAV